MASRKSRRSATIASDRPSDLRHRQDHAVLRRARFRDARLAVALTLSGAAGLAYELLWTRDWTPLLGSTAGGTAIVLCIYFGGLAVGRALGGQMAQRLRAQSAYGAVEIATALCCVAYVALRPGIPAACAALARFVPPSAVVGSRAALAASLLAVPTVLIGCTVPLAIHATDEPGRRAPGLYAWNMLGGAVGILLCGLVSVRILGIRRSLLAAAGLNLGAATIALAARGTAVGPRPGFHADATHPRALRDLSAAAVIGFVSLAVEVLWSRAMAGVSSNSLYSVATVIAMVLLGLVVGAAVAARLAARDATGDGTVALVLLLAAVTIGSSAVVYRLLLHVAGPAPSSVLGGLVREAWVAAELAFVPGACLGVGLPVLLSRATGFDVGTMLAVNTVAGVAGALATAFVVLPAIGIAGGIAACAAMLVLATGLYRTPTVARWTYVAAVGVATMAFVSWGTRLPERHRPDSSVLYYRDGPSATVAVTSDAQNRKELLVNGQSLGGTAGLFLEAREAHLPLLLTREPRRLLHVGVGTGDTIGAATSYPDLDVEGVELIGEVVAAAALFGRENHDLLQRPRVRVTVDDARTYLLSQSEGYDVVVSDLLVPWVAGESNLYSKEFYQSARDHLRPGGIFCQWLPMHQLTLRALQTIARTFVPAFEDVQVWLAYHRTATPLLALVGSNAPIVLDEGIVRARAAGPPRLRADLAYVGFDDVRDVGTLFVGGKDALRREAGTGAIGTDDNLDVELMAAAGYYGAVDLDASLGWLERVMEEPASAVERATIVDYEVRRHLLRGLRYFVAGDDRGEAGEYLEAVRRQPEIRAARAVLSAIGQELAGHGARPAALAIAGHLSSVAPASLEARELAASLELR